MRKNLLYFFLLPAFLLAITRCKKHDSGDNSTGSGNGIITGKVVAGNNTTPISQAHVFIEAGATIYSSFSDVNGNFSLEAPSGLRTLNIQTGNGHMFRTTLNVTIKPDESISIPNNKIKLNQVANLAFVAGEYDRIQTILVDTLGYTITAITTAAFQNIGNIIQYDAIFINCGNASIQPMNAVRDQNLATYVANGGSLYVSDYAVQCLTGMVNYLPCPNNRSGGFLPDSLLCTDRLGAVSTISNAAVVSSSLQAYLNKTQISVEYDLATWEQIFHASGGFWEVMVRNPANNQPLMIRTNQYTNNTRGTVSVGTQNNNGWVTICHRRPNGTLVTITINANALQAHLAHGDTIGECGNPNESGRIYYTTFHNAHNGQTGPDVKNILEYMILNL